MLQRFLKNSLFLLALGALLGLRGSASSDTAPGSHWAWVHGHRLYYEIKGHEISGFGIRGFEVGSSSPRGNGRPLLLLHGGGSSVAESFARQFDDFSAQHRVIAPEQVGQGHSPDVPGQLSYAAMLDDTVALLEQLHLDNLDVVGWSDGGILALMLASKYPQLVHRVVVSGANISPDGLLDSEYDALRRDIAASGTPSKLQQLWVSSPTPAELNWRGLQQLHKPVLVLAGDRDVIKPAHTKTISATLPQAQLSVLADTGHATFAERPDIVNPMVLKFLAQD